MEGDLYVTAQAPVNIAVIKYWGKRDEALILPLNSSLSTTLNMADLCTTTTVMASDKFTQDRLWLNGKEENLNTPRMQKCISELLDRSPLVKKDEQGKRFYFHICSVNNFPTAAGLASSASGFACLSTRAALSCFLNQIMHFFFLL